MEVRQFETQEVKTAKRRLTEYDSEIFKVTKFEMNKFSALFLCEYKVQILFALRAFLSSMSFEVVDTVTMSFVLMVASECH